MKKTKDLSVQEKLRKEFEDLVTQKLQHFVFGMPSIQWQEGVWSWISTNFVPKEEVEKVKEEMVKRVEKTRFNPMKDLTYEYLKKLPWNYTREQLEIMIKELQGVVAENTTQEILKELQDK